MRQLKALVTGFEPYAGRGRNPAMELARGIDGTEIAGMAVAGRGLPVLYEGLRAQVEALIEAESPDVMIGVGLWPGEPMIRLERLAANLADFEIPDNAGCRIEDAPLAGNGAAAIAATWPARRIQEALLAAGIPARLSATAGTFLCNATLYSGLAALAAKGGRRLCGFMHVPYLPEQVVELVGDLRREAKFELGQRADLASMELGLMRRALELALAACADALRR
jgi:pyroglutamyl-peptidase